MTSRRFTPNPFGYERLLGALVMHEHDVGVAATADVERLPGAEPYDPDSNAGPLREAGEEMAEEARLLRRGGRGNRDGALLGRAMEDAGRKGDKPDCDRAEGSH
jgi:hypothetical protein